MRRISLVIVASALILLALFTPAFGQGEGPDLSPVEGKFKVVFRNCLGTEVFADLKGEGLDFWEDRIEPNTADRTECPYRVVVVRPAINEKAPPQKYRGTVTTQQHGDTYTATYEAQSEPAGVAVIWFYRPGTADVTHVAGQGIPTPTLSGTAVITSTVAPTTTAAAPPAAGPSAPLPVSGDEESPSGGYKISPAEVAWALVLVGGLLVLVSRLVLYHDSSGKRT
jgi:hypothetical protein